MSQWFHDDPYFDLTRWRLCEMRAAAERARLLRQARPARQPRLRAGLRRRVGALLIATGEAVSSAPCESCQVS